jgi:hypothetical protein
MEWGQLQQQIQSQIAPQIQGAQQLSQQAELEKAMRTVAGRHPDDFEQVAGSLDEAGMQKILESGFPTEVMASLFNGGGDDKERALEMLYRWVKSEQAPALVEGAVEAVQASRDDAKAAKVAATVASATTTSPEQVEESEGERLMRVWAEQRPNMRSAWTGRS